ncbi:type I DNA topoisomerase [Actinomyces naeslundii]|uniref:DNA topoisomerase 1 n=2 Tax=Actinomyces naeslundii TaxID=1655 RepID=J3JJD7_ACTNH|nr:type I DNA topoisomerase [Actinomyces naeslundii]EJN84361.1 DNA topoisomerase I [Actinomyces naeslundii str. Howell 279]OMG31881.1 DNA topoisomerase I [Actinomyces naeslundii]QQC21757.1 type I DNA topoisomerase [Actinomyces naeslundii]
MSTKLVIVESPNKVRSIAGYLGPEFDVEASVGHIRDLPQPSELPATMKKGPYGKFAVDVEDDFTPYYVVNPDKKKTVAQLKKALKNADELYLATDDDREGEAIAWHLQQVLKPKVPVRRMVFTEITREAVTRALSNTRDLDIHLVDAQETRRILDRLVGYEVSPVLWRKVRAGLSAGRVQSVATRLVVERERERMAFRSASYWGVEADFSTVLSPVDVTARQDASFTARLVTLDGRRVATGRDFNDDGELRPAAVKASAVHLHQVGATAVAEAIGRGQPRVAGVEDKPYKRRPAAPFTTSTLQQEASRKLRMNPRETMRVAQGLYENGFITYMRTDSTVLSGQAVAAARSQVAELYGAEYVPERPRVYASKSKGAQEAHEAIRPAGDHFRTPAQVSGELTGAQFRLYELIWKRTVASQMADAVGSTATVTVEVPLTPAAGESRDSGPTFSTAGLTASGTVITFRGFLAAYEEGRDAERYQEDSGTTIKDAKDVRLPSMISGQELAALAAEASGHETTPPPRYTEASLVKALEEREIGRPSTYAATMSTISDRGYVDHRGQALVPTWLAFAVTRLLEENFTELVDYDFTASMERDLDRIAAGEEDRVAWLRRFYNGQGASGAAVEETAPTAGELDAAAALRAQGLKGLVDNLGEIDARAVNSIEIGEGITLRVGRYGPYLEDGEGKRANVPADVAPDELTVDKARELFARAADDGRELGVDPVSGHVIIAKDGRYGPYVTEVLPDPEEVAGTAAADSAAADGQSATKPARTATSTKTRRTAKAAKPKPRTASLLRSMDLSTVTLEQALDLLSLPRVVGQDPESGADITAQNGRYGPYLKKGTDSRSLETEEQIFTVTLEQALEIFAQPKRRRGQAAARGPLRELGEDPATGKPVVIKDGRFGPYFTDGETNVTLRRGDDPATVTPERAFELLAEKRAKGPAKKRTTRKTTAKKTAAKKTTAKKTTAKKAAAKTATSKAASKEA